MLGLLVVGAGLVVMPIAAGVALVWSTVALRARTQAWQWPWAAMQIAFSSGVLGWALMLDGWPAPWMPALEQAGLSVLGITYLALSAAVLGFFQRRTGRRRTDVWMDAALVMLAFSVMVIDVVLDPGASLGTSRFQLLALLLLPLALAVGLGAVIHLVAATRGRHASSLLLLAAGSAVLAGDVGHLILDGVLHPALLACWAAGYLLAAGAIVHPSADGLTWRRPMRTSPVGPFLSSAAALFAVGFVVVRAFLGDGVAWGVAVGTAGVLLAVLLRVGQLLMQRERHLRIVDAQRRREAILHRTSQAAAVSADRRVLERTLLDGLDAYGLADVLVTVDGAPTAPQPDVITVGHGRCWASVPSRVELGADDRAFLRSLTTIGAGVLERLTLIEQLETLARRDVLTGLWNRRAAGERLEAVLEEADATPVAVVYLDVDDFKAVNDRHGHDVGDRVLATIGSRLAAAVRPDDMAARLGGDEFILTCPGLDRHDAQALTGRLGQPVLVRITTDTPPITVSLSVGVVESWADATAGALLQAADRAMYDVKQAGAGR